MASAQVGWLQKKGGIRKNWLSRWFELETDGVLVYYTDPDTRERKGAIRLWEASDVRESTASRLVDAAASLATEIEIVTPARTWRVRTETEAERDVWLQAMRQSAVAARTQRAAATTEQQLAAAGAGPDRVLMATQEDDLVRQVKLMLSRGFLPWEGVATVGSANHQLYVGVSESPDLAKQIQDYCIVVADVHYSGWADRNLTPKVMELIRLGWRPYGGVAAVGDNSGELSQVMVLPRTPAVAGAVAYRVVSASGNDTDFVSEFGASVSGLLKSGWHTVGGVAARGKNVVHLYQAVVRHDDDLGSTGSEEYSVASFQPGSMLPSGSVDSRPATDGIAEDVARLISDGWSTVGGVNTAGIFNGMYQALVRGVQYLPNSAACRRYSVQVFSFNAHPELRRDDERTIVLGDPDSVNWDGRYLPHYRPMPLSGLSSGAFFASKECS